MKRNEPNARLLGDKARFSVLVLSYLKNIGIRRAISSGNLEELCIIWQPQIKDNVKSYLDLFQNNQNETFAYSGRINNCALSQIFIKYTKLLKI